MGSEVETSSTKLSAQTTAFDSAQAEKTRMRKIGLMGGTFDPIHFGHLFIAEEARLQEQLEQVLFIPNHTPAHVEGKQAHLDGETRLRMVECGIEGNEYFAASRIELDRPGASFAWDTITQLREEMPGSDFFFIVGADSIRDVLTWYRGGQLFELCRFIAATRPGYDIEAAKARLSPFQLERTRFINVPGLHIASSELRERVKKNRPIRYLVPEKVREEIERLALYR